MKVLIDGLFFQLANTGIARVWTSLLGKLVKMRGLELYMLDRGRCPNIKGVQLVAFPSYTATYTAQDSLLIQSVCDKIEIDVFTSTYYTTATGTPQLQMVYDMIPEVLGFDLSLRTWKEKKLALSYAAHFACISNNTRSDLLRLYPHIDPERAVVTYCGVDNGVFNPSAAQGLPMLRGKYGLDRPYLLLVGSRTQHRSYKNADLLFDAVRAGQMTELDIVCVGGEAAIDTDHLRDMPPNTRVLRLDLTDAELASIYTGAIALVYPSLYEGFGMPVVEAMACGCPVITTRHGSLAEVAGDAALIVNGRDLGELQLALMQVREADERERLTEAGLKWSARFDWKSTAEQFADLLHRVRVDESEKRFDKFYSQWRRVRTLQAEVDVGVD